MARYKCVRCGKQMESLPEGSIRCPSCSFRVIEKIRPAVAAEVSAK